MGTWMGLCCLLVTRSSFSSRDLHVASRACSLASMLSNRKQIVWLMEYRNDCKTKTEELQEGPLEVQADSSKNTKQLSPHSAESVPTGQSGTLVVSSSVSRNKLDPVHSQRDWLCSE